MRFTPREVQHYKLQKHKCPQGTQYCNFALFKSTSTFFKVYNGHQSTFRCHFNYGRNLQKKKIKKNVWRKNGKKLFFKKGSRYDLYARIFPSEFLFLMCSQFFFSFKFCKFGKKKVFYFYYLFLFYLVSFFCVLNYLVNIDLVIKIFQ